MALYLSYILHYHSGGREEKRCEEGRTRTGGDRGEARETCGESPKTGASGRELFFFLKRKEKASGVKILQARSEEIKNRTSIQA